MTHGANPQLAARAWRIAKRLFGARADNHEVSADMPALLIARDMQADQNLAAADAVAVAIDVIPEANAETVLSMLQGDPVDSSYRCSADRVAAATGSGRR